MKKLMITGISGLLGYALAKYFQADWQITGTFLTHKISWPNIHTIPIDLTQYAEVKSIFKQFQPDAIIHTAALTSPNQCQMQPDKSYSINVKNAEYIASLSHEFEIPCVFTSTDLVFDGQHAPYVETDEALPLNLYGEHKLLAESRMRQIYPYVTICRLPLMYGTTNHSAQSFVQPIIQAMHNHQPLSLFIDEFRTPVSTTTIAQGIAIALNYKGEIFHLGGHERISRYELGVLIQNIIGQKDAWLIPCQQKDIASMAPRPQNVSFNSAKAYQYGYRPPPLAEDLKKLFGNLH